MARLPRREEPGEVQASRSSSKDWGRPPDQGISSDSRDNYNRKGRFFAPSPVLAWRTYVRACEAQNLPLVGKEFISSGVLFDPGSVLYYIDDPREFKSIVSSLVLTAKKTGRVVPTLVFSYELIEKYLEGGNTHKYSSLDFLVLVIGEGEARNRYLPELVASTLSARSSKLLPTLVLASKPLREIVRKYERWSDAETVEQLTSITFNNVNLELSE